MEKSKWEIKRISTSNNCIESKILAIIWSEQQSCEIKNMKQGTSNIDVY